MEVFDADETNRQATWIAAYMLVHRKDAIDVRTIQRSYPALKKPENRTGLNKAMQFLETCDWVRPEKWSRDGKPLHWGVNPSVHDGRFAAITEAEQTRRDGVR